MREVAEGLQLLLQLRAETPASADSYLATDGERQPEPA